VVRFPPALLFAFTLTAGDGVITSLHSPGDAQPTASPDSAFWKEAPPVFADRSGMGDLTPGHRTEIRSRWTNKYLYFLFICPYEQLHLKPNPVTSSETNNLWEWDVAEVFIGADPANIRRYKEFEVSPQGEWVDLDINLDKPPIQQGWVWNSGFDSKARIDQDKKIWYAEMRIPFSAIDPGAPSPASKYRVNFYRIQGPPSSRRSIAWQATGKRSYHVPESFGTLQLSPPGSGSLPAVGSPGAPAAKE
jgi:hypothetical protein